MKKIVIGDSTWMKISFALLIVIALLVVGIETNAIAGSSKAQQVQKTPAYIGMEMAKQVSLQSAGKKQSEATFTKAHFDMDDGIAHYDIEFVAGGFEYDYEINALNGSVVEESIEKVVKRAPVKKSTNTGTSNSGSSNSGSSQNYDTSNYNSGNSSNNGGGNQSNRYYDDDWDDRYDDYDDRYDDDRYDDYDDRYDDDRYDDDRYDDDHDDDYDGDDDDD